MRTYELLYCVLNLWKYTSTRSVRVDIRIRYHCIVLAVQGLLETEHLFEVAAGRGQKVFALCLNPRQCSLQVGWHFVQTLLFKYTHTCNRLLHPDLQCEKMMIGTLGFYLFIYLFKRFTVLRLVHSGDCKHHLLAGPNNIILQGGPKAVRFSIQHINGTVQGKMRSQQTRDQKDSYTIFTRASLC